MAGQQGLLPAGPVAVSALCPPMPHRHRGRVLPAWTGAGGVVMVPQEPAVPASIVGPVGGLATVRGVCGECREVAGP